MAKWFHPMTFTARLPGALRGRQRLQPLRSSRLGPLRAHGEGGAARRRRPGMGEPRVAGGWWVAGGGITVVSGA